MRIIIRLGLEKELKIVVRHLKFFSFLLLFFLVLSVFAFIGLRQVLVNSSFGPFVSIIFSDPVMALKYWDSFLLSVFESVPGLDLAILFLAGAFAMLFVRYLTIYLGKFLSINKSIKKQKYGYK